MRNYIQEFCATCDTCLQGKHPNTNPKTYQAIALDISTLTSSFDGYRCATHC